MQRDFAPVHVTAAFCTLHEPHDHRRCVDNTRGGALQACCTRQLVTHARAMHCSRLSHTIRRPSGLSCDMHATMPAAQQLLASWASPPTFSAWLMRRLISAASRLLSSPVTRSHLGHSAQAFWAGSKSWHTLCAHALRPRRSETC